MSNTPDSSESAALKAEAQIALNEIKAMRVAAEEHLKAAEAARRKADEDASYANQAKVNTEEHSKSTAVFKGTAEADLNAITANKKNFEELIANVAVGKAAAEADVKAIAEGRKSIDQSVTTLTEISNTATALAQKNAEDRSAIEASKRVIDQAEEASTKARERATTAQTEIDELSRQATALLGKITSEQESSTRVGTAMTEVLRTANSDRDNLAKILDHIAKSDAKSTEYEVKIADLTQKFVDLNKQAESFLPGATSAGLAHSFNAQKTRFQEPQRRWLKTFVWCMVGLGLISAPNFFTAVFGTLYGIQAETQWEDIFRGMAMRLPIVVPLVWLAIYSGRNYMLSLRIEEEYAYKEALSRAFEGYKREMKEIAAGDAANPTPLNRFCLNVLTALAERPGRIYDGKQDFTLLNEAKELLDKADELRKKQLAHS